MTISFDSQYFTILLIYIYTALYKNEYYLTTCYKSKMRGLCSADILKFLKQLMVATFSLLNTKSHYDMWIRLAVYTSLDQIRVG